jgi:hypothetical protein
MAKRKFGVERKDYLGDLSRKQGSIEFSTEAINSDDMGNGDFRFTSLKASQIDAGVPAKAEGRFYIKDREGILYYITATKVG